MTVVVQTPYNAHLANGVTTLFGFTFQLLDEGDLQVSLDGVVQVSGFTIAGVGVQAGGSVTFSVAPANNVLVEIQRAIPLARSTDYQQNGDLPSATVDEDFDRIWQALQDAAYFAGLTVGLPAGDTAAPMVLPAVADRASRFFAFNAQGEAIAALGTLPDVPVTAFGASLIDDVDAAAARSTLGLGTVAVESVNPIAKGGTGQVTAAAAFNALKQNATDTATGVVELATAAEVATGTDTSRAITPAALRAGPIQSTIRLQTANGYGSTNNRIRRWSTVLANVGSDMTLVQNAANGDHVVINNAGNYIMSFTDSYTTTDVASITLNDSSPAGALVLAEALALNQSSSANFQTQVAVGAYLPAGSIVRARSSGGNPVGSTNASMFTITRAS